MSRKKIRAIGGNQGKETKTVNTSKSVNEIVTRSKGVRATIIEGTPTPRLLKITKGTVAQTGDLKNDAFGGIGNLVKPMYDPALLQEIVTESPILGICIECMAVNVDGQGYTLNVIAEQGISPKKIAAERKAIKYFLDYLNYDESFTSLRMKARRDMEKIGWGAWEFVRNGKGDIAEVNYIPGKYLRISKQDSEYTEFTQKVIDAEGKIGTVTRKKKFRKYAWFANGQINVWYKEFGDPRFISCKDGRIVSKVKEEDLATEIYMFKMLDDGTVYPAPRWLGSLLAAVGARRAEELNYTYFDNNMFIPFVILVSGGVLTQDSMERIKTQLEEGRGDKKPFRALILEAMPMDASAAVFDEGRAAAIRVEIKPLIETVKDDMLFSSYDEQSRNKQRLAFRLPKILLGEAEDYNRATAESALSIVNAQVFNVERDEFDDFINRKIFPMMGFIYHTFESLPYRASDPQVLAEVLMTLSQTGVLSPATARVTASEILGREIVLPDAEYIKYPFPLVQALILMEVFGIKELQGDLQVPEEFRGKSREEIKKWVIDLLQVNPSKPALDAEVSDDILDELIQNSGKTALDPFTN